MRLSVIIPTRSRYFNVKGVLEALFDQSLDKSQYEIILSDDNSTDDTQSSINTFRDRGRFKYVFNNWKPYSWNASIPRNYGALISDPETQAFVFVDSDVILPHDALEHIVEDLDKDPNRVIIGPYHWYAEGNDRIREMDIRWEKFQRVSVDDTFDTVHDGLACFGGNITIPKDIFWSVRGFSVDTHIGLEDGDMGLKLWKKGTKFSYDIRLLGKHQWHPVPPDRFPPDMRDHIDRLNEKHFHSREPDYGLIEASRETYAEWGITGWDPPKEWNQNRKEFMLKVNKEDNAT